MEISDREFLSLTAALVWVFAEESSGVSSCFQAVRWGYPEMDGSAAFAALGEVGVRGTESGGACSARFSGSLIML